MDNKFIIIMDSIHYILKAEKLLKKSGINDFDIIPVPKEIHSNCGSAIEIENEETFRNVISILNSKNFNFKIFKFNTDLNFYIEIGGEND